jgi:hypothetical protein
LDRRAVRTLVGIAAVAALGWLVWRAEFRRVESLDETPSVPAAAHGAPAAERAELETDASELARPAQPAPGARAELASLTGTLKVSGENIPLAGFLVSLEGGLTHPTDAQGVFEFQGLAPGPARLRVDTSAAFDPLERSLELAPGANQVELRLTPRFELAVVVVEHGARPGAPRQPLAGASVRLENARETAAFFEREGKLVAGKATTDASGRCALSGLVAGDYVLVAELDGHIPSRVPLACSYRDELARARPRTILMALAPASGVLRGRVKGPDRQPVEGALVCLDTSAQEQRTFPRVIAGVTLPSPPYTISDAEGAFELPLPKGELEIAVIVCSRHPDLSPITRRSVPPEHLEREVAVEIARARRLKLVVLGPEEDVVGGRLSVRAGELAYDLASNPLLAAIPGFVGFFADPLLFTGTEVELSLPDGGCEVRFDGGPGVLGSWFVNVDASSPEVIELRLP